jgi:hypothetical protein
MGFVPATAGDPLGRLGHVLTVRQDRRDVPQRQRSEPLRGGLQVGALLGTQDHAHPRGAGAADATHPPVAS